MPNDLGPSYGAGQGLGQLLAALIARSSQQPFRQQPLGTALGFPAQPPTIPTPNILQTNPAPLPGAPLQPRPVMGPTMPIASPIEGPGGVMTAMPPPMTYPTAPAAMQPLMGKPVGDIMQLSKALGEPTMRDLMGTMGVSRSPGSNLEYDEATGEFKIKAGAKQVPTQSANVILRQKDIKDKKKIEQWKHAIEKRLGRGQLAKEEAIALRADSELLGFMLDPEFDMLNDTMKTQLQAQATAAINRLQQRGVKVFTGSRARSTAPAAQEPVRKADSKSYMEKTSEYYADQEKKGWPEGDAIEAGDTDDQPAGKDRNASRMQRYTEIKAKNPTLTDEQIAAQIAIEEESL